MKLLESLNDEWSLMKIEKKSPSSFVFIWTHILKFRISSKVFNKRRDLTSIGRDWGWRADATNRVSWRTIVDYVLSYYIHVCSCPLNWLLKVKSLHKLWWRKAEALRDSRCLSKRCFQLSIMIVIMIVKMISSKQKSASRFGLRWSTSTLSGIAKTENFAQPEN